MSWRNVCEAALCVLINSRSIWGPYPSPTIFKFQNKNDAIILNTFRTILYNRARILYTLLFSGIHLPKQHEQGRSICKQLVNWWVAPILLIVYLMFWSFSLPIELFVRLRCHWMALQQFPRTCRGDILTLFCFSLVEWGDILQALANRHIPPILAGDGAVVSEQMRCRIPFKQYDSVGRYIDSTIEAIDDLGLSIISMVCFELSIVFDSF